MGCGASAGSSGANPALISVNPQPSTHRVHWPDDAMKLPTQSRAPVHAHSDLAIYRHRKSNSLEIKQKLLAGDRGGGVLNGVVLPSHKEILHRLADQAASERNARAHFNKVCPSGQMSRAQLSRAISEVYSHMGVACNEIVEHWLDVSLLSMIKDPSEPQLTEEEFLVLHGCTEVFATAKRANPRTPQAIASTYRKHVFLGGSCNPTTWRADVAIPLLEESKVTFYNPQTDNWHPGLIEEEARAKESCHVLLFVIDKATRSISSMLEAVEYVMRGRMVALVIEDIHDGTEIDGQILTGRELKDMNRARAFLTDIVERHAQNATLFHTIEESLQFVVSKKTIQWELGD